MHIYTLMRVRMHLMFVSACVYVTGFFLHHRELIFFKTRNRKKKNSNRKGKEKDCIFFSFLSFSSFFLSFIFLFFHFLFFFVFPLRHMAFFKFSFSFKGTESGLIYLLLFLNQEILASFGFKAQTFFAALRTNLRNG